MPRVLPAAGRPEDVLAHGAFGDRLRDMSDRPMSGDLEAARLLLFDDALWLEAEYDARPRAVDSSDVQA